MAGSASGTREPAGPAAELEDRSAGPSGQGDVEVEVARVLDQVDVVQAGEARVRSAVIAREPVAVSYAAPIGSWRRPPASRRAR